MAKLSIIVVLTSLFLTACGIAAKIDARNDMAQSKNIYKSCLAQHPNNISACDGARLSYEADLQAYRATSAGIRPGTVTEVNINN